MAGGSALVGWLKAVFIVLGSVMVATLLYTIAIDGLPFRIELLTPWMAATLVDYYINVVPLAAWVSYKETNLVARVVWIILLVCLGSVTTCGYITLQLFKLSAEESTHDLMYHLLLRNQNKNGIDRKNNGLQLTTARVAFSVLGFIMLGTLVWVGYKESRWFGKVAWITGLICFGSIVTSAYVAYQFFQLSPFDPLYLVVLNRKQRQKAGMKGHLGNAVNAIFMSSCPCCASMCSLGGQAGVWRSAPLITMLLASIFTVLHYSFLISCTLPLFSSSLAGAKMRHHSSRTLRRLVHHLTPRRQPPPPLPLTTLSLSSTLHRLVPPASIRQFSRSFGAQSSSSDVNAEVDEINLKFAEAREEIESAMESKETVYFDEEAEIARVAVRETVELFEGLLGRLEGKERDAVVRSMGLKIEQLKAELQQLNE
ncbi:Embryogenesis-like protein [Drosera capensis]